MLLPPPAPLRVLTYNIHHANPPARPGAIDLDAIARVIVAQKPDVVMLQELDVRTRRSGVDLDQAAELGRKTGMGSYFARAIDFDGGEYGVALLSRHPMTDRRRLPLPTKPETKGEPRVLALATLNLPDGRRVVVACTHLDAQKAGVNRHLQAKAIADQLRAETLPVILGGDFNDTPGSETRRILGAAAEGFEGEPTIPADAPRSTIDFVVSSPKGSFHVVSREVVAETTASDHRPLLVVLEPAR